MKAKNLLTYLLIAGIYACSGGDSGKETKEDSFDATQVYGEGESKAPEKAADDSKGIGKFTNVEVSPNLDKPMADQGLKVYDLKCSACHKLTDEKLVGPGWKGVTSRRKAEWVMNFTTNVDEMLAKDPVATAMLEECLVRMPNQNLSDEDARSVYEYMRQNDGVK